MKVKESNYGFSDKVKEKLTLETVLFLSNCLQHDENNRKDVTELIKHPYVTKTYDEQVMLSPKQLAVIFKNKPGA